VLEEAKLREEVQEASRFRKRRVFQVNVKVSSDDQLAVVGGEDFQKRRELGEEGWRHRRGARPVEGEDSEWPSGGRAGEAEELEGGEGNGKRYLFNSKMISIKDYNAPVVLRQWVR
jgi:hypothetical protein